RAVRRASARVRCSARCDGALLLRALLRAAWVVVWARLQRRPRTLRRPRTPLRPPRPPRRAPITDAITRTLLVRSSRQGGPPALRSSRAFHVAQPPTGPGPLDS